MSALCLWGVRRVSRRWRASVSLSIVSGDWAHASRIDHGGSEPSALSFWASSTAGVEGSRAIFRKTRAVIRTGAALDLRSTRFCFTPAQAAVMMVACRLVWERDVCSQPGVACGELLVRRSSSTSYRTKYADARRRRLWPQPSGASVNQSISGSLHRCLTVGWGLPRAPAGLAGAPPVLCCDETTQPYRSVSNTSGTVSIQHPSRLHRERSTWAAQCGSN